jgi:hypothetical protein
MQLEKVPHFLGQVVCQHLDGDEGCDCDASSAIWERRAPHCSTDGDHSAYAAVNVYVDGCMRWGCLRALGR